MSFGAPLSAAEAAIYESLVVPRYMHFFADTAVAMLLPMTGGRILHFGCRTGYPALAIVERLPACGLCGVDNSPAALELANTKAAMLRGAAASYLYAETLPLPIEAQQFTHVLALHPSGWQGQYAALFQELFRLLMPGGQMVVALPLRRSFPAIYDLLREYAVRFHRQNFDEAVTAAINRRPNPELLSSACEEANFVEVDVSVDLVGATFENGRDFLEDPISRLVVAPDIRGSLEGEAHLDEAMAYTAEAIGKYWSELPFELMVNIGCVSARRPF